MADLDQKIRLEITVDATQTALLEGLVVWQSLGLLTEQQVRQICRQYLVCSLPEVVPAVTDALTSAEPSREPDFITDFGVSKPKRREKARRDRPSAPTPVADREAGWVASRFQALMDEISVIWLLFLGVFMVVVSSGVLAASQWQNVSPTGQYLILFAYTLGFFGAGLWAGTRPALQLTAQMVQMAALLIIPINFWMMDVIRLWARPLGWAIAPLATGILLFALVRLLRPAIAPPAHPRWVVLNAVAVSGLHWGWNLTGIPLIACYLATVGSAVVLTTQFPPQPSGDAAPGVGLSRPVVAITLSVLLLLVRALWIAGVPLSELGLALGICGAVFCWQARQIPARMLWARVGVGLMVVGWLVTVGADPPWQAIAISVLGLALLGDRLVRLQSIPTLVALFGVGLQAYWLLGKLVPSSTRESLLDWLMAQAGTPGMPLAGLGLTLFPYVMATVGLAGWYHRQGRSPLAKTAELLALSLGTALLLVGGLNPLMRSLTLSLALFTLLVAIRWRRQLPHWLLYMTHLVGLAAIAAWIEWVEPDLSGTAWAGLTLGFALGEWGFCAIPQWSDAKQSSWHLGIGLAALSGFLFWDGVAFNSVEWLWLAAPLALTGLAHLPWFPPYRTAVKLSTVGAIAIQSLTFGEWQPRLVSLGLMALLLLVNTRRLPLLGNAIAAVGLGTAFVGAAAWKLLDFNTDAAPLVLPLMLLGLWGLWHWQSRQDTPLSRIYAPALTGWAIVLSGLNFGALMFYALVMQFDNAPLSLQGTVGTLIFVGAIAYRLWLCPTNWGFFSLAIPIEVLLITVVYEQDWTMASRITVLAIANLVLGLLTQLAGDGWVLWKNRDYRLSWHLVPIGYATLGVTLAHITTFSATTGFYALGFALVGIGVGRRQPVLKAFVYLALAMVTLGAYELLVYQLSQAPEGDIGDGLVLLAGLAALISLGDRLLSRWLLPYLRLTSRELKGFALAHWIFGSGLLLLALFLPRSTTGGALWTGVALILAVDALWGGRIQTNQTYAGISALTLAIAYGLWLLFPDTDLLLTWAGAIATPFACAMELAPWQRLGWNPRPWQRSALVIPILIILLSANWVAIPTLLIVGAFYAWFARTRRQIRLSYISLVLAIWAIWGWLDDRLIMDAFWRISLISLSLLYIVQVDPGLRSPTDRQTRHSLRMLAVGLIILSSIYEAETSLWFAAIALGIDLVLILLGLVLRVRAYLFIGTIAFLYQILRQLVILIGPYPLLIWVIGIILGLLFIWIAATFEARRAQVSALVRYWMAELEQWE